MPRIECIAIGSELLNTQRLDTNSVWLAERLGEMGLTLHCKTAVGDVREDMARLFRTALERSDIILCTGGLGPTFDDFTKEVWAEVVGAPMREDPLAREEMLAFYAARQRVPSASNFQQVILPEGSEGCATRPAPPPASTGPTPRATPAGASSCSRACPGR